MIRNTKTVQGTYGSQFTPCDVFVVTDYNGLNWYAVEDSRNVNATYDEIEDGVDVETLADVDYFYSSEAIESEEMLEQHCDR